MSSADSGPTDADLFGLPVPNPEHQEAAREPVEVIVSRFLDELRAGGNPSVAEYIARHPHHRAALEELLPAASALEGWRTQQEATLVKRSMPSAEKLHRLGDCRILREIGRGGMGVVFEAEQEPTGRRVAVKVLPNRFSAKTRWRDHFLQEASTAARLQHKNIVPVYQFGEQDGWCYYVMQLVRGVSLDQIIELWISGEDRIESSTVRQLFEDSADSTGEESHTVPPTRPRVSPDVVAGTLTHLRTLRPDAWKGIARIGVQVGQALKHAHHRGVLHRDIKPGNLLIDSRGSIWITDFGLALTVDQLLHSSEPAIAGTLRYLAPEQLEGQVDQRSDIYSLGATLYELLSQRPVYEAATAQAMIDQLRTTGPPTLRSIKPNIPRSLDTIVARAMSRDPLQRYPAVEFLVADLLRFTRQADRKKASWRNLFGLWR